MTARPASGAGTWAGCIVAPLAWAAQQMAGSITGALDCRAGSWATLAICLAGCLAVAVATLVSRASRRAVQPPARPASFTEQRLDFVGVIGSAMPLVFLAAMVWQAAATLVYAGCAP